jgi:hypothetical protein
LAECYCLNRFIEISKRSHLVKASGNTLNRDSCFFLLCHKTKSPGFSGTSLSLSVIFFNNTLLLKSRLGLKVVVKIKECVAEFHFSFNTELKIKRF